MSSLTPADLRHLCLQCQKPLRSDNGSGHCYTCKAPKGIKHGPVSHVGTKVCGACSRDLPRSEFAINRTCTDLQQAHCRECRTTQDQAYRASMSDERRAEIRAYARNHRLLTTYGMTQSDWDRLWIAQGEACGLCRTVDPGSRGDWVTDHCHSTGVVRGILCHHCNLALGWFENGWALAGFKELVSSYLNGVHNA